LSLDRAVRPGGIKELTMTEARRHTKMRVRWSAIGAAVAVTLGAGGLSIAQAAVSTGERPVVVTVDAERILDTRADLGLAGKFADSTPRDLQVTGSVDVASGGSKIVVPDDAVGVIVNVTVIRPNRPGFLSLRPAGAAGAPTTSTVNFTDGSIEPNSATVDLNNGKIQIWLATIADAGRADVAIDVVGYTIDHDHDDRYARMFYHESTAGNVNTNLTALDHPDLNGNPDALVAVTHMYKNDYLDAIGTWYSVGLQQWTVYNEDETNFPTGESFAITYIVDRNGA
jgi:predicted secreted protein